MDGLKQFCTIIFLLIAIIKINASECKSYSLIEARYLNYSQFDLIALCRLEDNGFLTIIKSFKGTLRSNEGLTLKTSLSFKAKDTWLIYANYKVDGNSTIVNIDECSISRSLNNPLRILVNIRDYSLPSPNLDGDVSSELIEALKVKARSDFMEELNWLQNQEILNKINLVNNSRAEITKNSHGYVYYLLFTIIILLQIFIITKLFYKK